jgi:pimeloyl-ACP methyl ester carboxylesterase/uncharacterized membrane protein HdeD (DUF308 family)
VSCADRILHVRYDEGHGPLVVLLHGINSDGTDWRAVIDDIGPDCRCIALDLLGFGDSPKPLDCDYTADDHAAAVHATLLSLGVHSPFLLVGYSLGGDVALRFASTWPEMVRRLFLLSTPFYLPPDAYSAKGFSGDYADAMIFQWMWDFVAGSKQHNNLVYQIANGKAEEFAKGFLHTTDVSQHFEVMGRTLQNTIAATNMVDDLPRLTMPVTFALGIKDPIVRPDQTPALKRLKPDIEIRRIVGLTADHMMLANLPDTVAREIMRDEIRTLHVAKRAGSGDPVVLLHGLQNSSAQFAPLADALAVDHTVLVVDLLGFGGSPAPHSLRYDLADHVTALRNTLRTELGGKPATLVGIGLGANIALGMAAEDPAAVAQVVAFSPAFVPPGASASDAASDRDIANLLAARELAQTLGADERGAKAAEKVEERALAQVRSLDNAIIGVDGAALLGSVRRPVEFVTSAGDARPLVDYLAEQTRAHAGLGWHACTIETPGAFAMPDAARALDIVAPLASERAREVARSAQPVPRPTRASLLDIATRADTGELVRGLVALLGGLALFVLPAIVPNEVARFGLVRLAFSGWALVDGATTIMGAVGLARARKAWVSFFLIGTLSVLVALLVFAGPRIATWIIGGYLAFRALWFGLANLIAAKTVPDVKISRRMLWAQAVIGLAVALLIPLVPQLGGRLFRITLSSYLIGSGFTAVAFAWTARRQTAKRVAELLRRG